MNLLSCIAALWYKVKTHDESNIVTPVQMEKKVEKMCQRHIQKRKRSKGTFELQSSRFLDVLKINEKKHDLLTLKYLVRGRQHPFDGTKNTDIP